MKKPTDEQIKDFIDYFSDKLPDPHQEPLKFLHYWRLYCFIKGI